MSSISETILRFHDALSADPLHRFRSWGHCYRYFRRRRTLRGKGDLDGGALHLGFFLASWGMYRGSAFLLWKDYRIHRLAVREVLRPRYDALLALRPGRARQASEAARLILGLVEAVRNSYCDQVERVNGRRCAVEVTDTLASKILLSTLGCVPAYDAYVVRGLRAEGIPTRRLMAGTLGYCSSGTRTIRRPLNPFRRT